MEDITGTYAPPGGGGPIGGTESGPAGLAPTTAAPAAGNPRRKPEHQSVSLKNNPSFSPPTLQHAPLNPDHAALLHNYSKSQLEVPSRSVNDPSSKEPHPMASVDTEHSSGGDSNIRSNPDDWYTSWNTRVKENNRTVFNDDDPPYYLAGGKGKKKKPPPNPKPANYPSNETSYPDSGLSSDAAMPVPGFGYGPGGGLPLSMNQGLSFRPLLDDSLSDSGSFRSVIDDLTIKNQKLKKRLKKLERLHCNDQTQDKLFEVRVHGLSLDKKRELHDLLQRFATTLNVDSSNSASSSGYINSSIGASPFTKSSMNPPSSLPQTAPTDSAYATDSRVSSTPSNAILPLRGPIAARVPSSTLPQQNKEHINEKAKMKNVVKRLEHLFTGREALRSALAPSQAQQDIANKAAQDDVEAKLAAGEAVREEGPREAQLMTWQQDKDMTDAEYAKEIAEVNSGDDNDRSGIDQRPTRPLDLDPQRSQVPADNVVYLEHMTLSLQDENANFIPNDKNKASNWLYLNLITNLAQLHTLNVTVPFIKRAIQLYSTKLELSSDGKKIRWKGGSDSTKLSSDGSRSNSGENTNSIESSPSDDANARVGSNPIANSSGVTLSSVTSSGGLKNSGVASSSMNGAISNDNTASSANATPPKSPRQAMLEKFKYKPLLGAFNNHRGFDDGTDSDGTDSGDSLMPAEPAPGPPPILDANASPQPIENLKKMAPIDGPVIYFGASFCIDLSSQLVFNEPSLESSNTRYHRHSEVPIGPERPPSQCSSVDRTQSLLFNANDSMVPMEHEDFDVNMDLEPLDSKDSTEPFPRELEASGLGGVRPEDNFVLHVRTSHSRANNTVQKVRVRHLIPQSSLDVFFRDANDEMPNSKPNSSPHRILSVQNKPLEPSKLPSPSYGIFSSSSEESEVPNTMSSDSRMVSDSDMSYNFPIDLDSRSEGDDDAGGWASSGNHSKMELDKLEVDILEDNQQAESTAATAGGSFNGDLSPLRGEFNPKSTLLKPMDHLSLTGGIGISIDSPGSSESHRVPLKRSYDSSQEVNQQKPPTKVERIE